MEGHSHLALVFKVLLHAAIAFTGKLSFLFGYSLMQINILIGNLIMATGLSILGISAYILSRGHGRYRYLRLVMLGFLVVTFLYMLFEANRMLLA